MRKWKPTPWDYVKANLLWIFVFVKGMVMMMLVL